jgi:hypothetical protein
MAALAWIRGDAFVAGFGRLNSSGLKSSEMNSDMNSDMNVEMNSEINS